MEGGLSWCIKIEKRKRKSLERGMSGRHSCHMKKNQNERFRETFRGYTQLPYIHSFHMEGRMCMTWRKK